MRLRMFTAFTALLALFGIAAIAADSSTSEEDTKSTAPAVHVAPLLMMNNRVFTYAEINDSPRRLFFVDNGWSDTTLRANITDFEPVNDGKPVTVAMMHKKRVTEHYGRIDSLEFGELSLHEPVVRFSEQMDVLSRGLGKRVFGVLGYKTIRNYLTTFDFRRKKVYFYRHTPGTVAEMQDVDGNVSLPFGDHTFSAASEQIFSVKMVVNGVEIDAVVDLGYNGGLLTTIPPAEFSVRRTRLGKTFPVAVSGYTGKGARTHAIDVEVGQHKLTDIHTVFFDSKSAPRFTLVGVDFLRHFRVTFDYVNKMMYLVPNS